MIRSPDWTGNLAANYEIEALGGSVLLHSNVYFTSKFYFDPANRNIQPSYALLNARATWTDLSDRYSVAVFMNNITDRAYRTQVLPQGLNTAVSWGLPRMYGVTLGFRY